jgi:hypothetical protein
MIEVQKEGRIVKCPHLLHFRPRCGSLINWILGRVENLGFRSRWVEAGRIQCEPHEVNAYVYQRIYWPT